MIKMKNKNIMKRYDPKEDIDNRMYVSQIPPLRHQTCPWL